MGIRDVTSWLERRNVTAQSFGEGFVNLINVIIEGHRSFGEVFAFRVTGTNTRGMPQ